MNKSSFLDNLYLKSKTINIIKVMFNAQRNEEPIIRASNPHLIFS